MVSDCGLTTLASRPSAGHFGDDRDRTGGGELLSDQLAQLIVT